MFGLVKSAFDGTSVQLRGSQMILKQESVEMHAPFVTLLSHSLFKQYLLALISHATSLAHLIISVFFRELFQVQLCVGRLNFIILARF